MGKKSKKAKRDREEQKAQPETPLQEEERPLQRVTRNPDYVQSAPFLPRRLHREVKAYLYLSGGKLTFSKLVETLLREWLESAQPIEATKITKRSGKGEKPDPAERKK
jgi:hypothetical protein